MAAVNWSQFPRTPMNVPEENLTFHTWLEKSEFLNSVPFETLSHYTTFERADDILMTSLKANRVNDYSCITKIPDAEKHPLHFQKVLWVIPDLIETTHISKYGNIRFFTKNLKILDNLNFYIVEFIDNCMQPVARVLATTKYYPELLEFDVMKEGNGPIYRNPKGEFFKYSAFKRSSWSYYEEFDVEIMLEILEQVHNCISYVKCLNPRSIVKNDQYTEKIRSFDCEFGELQYAMFHFRHRNNAQYEIKELHPSNQESIQTIVTTELTSQWYPLVTKHQCNNNNPNFLVQQLCFDKSLYNREIEWEDVDLIEDLHFLYIETGLMPDAHVMVSKLLECKAKMRYFRSFKETFELFIDHFKSKDAQVEAQNALTKFLFFH